ncbi:MAG: DUF1552 domain-containing protein [Deltaproteobacteria bacterium]|nr:DUF1552 domain-containing protein [Deltaproteobacteria bacterium]
MKVGRRTALGGLLATAAGIAGVAGRGASAGPPPATRKKRLVLVMTPNGTQQSRFWPTDGFRSPILDPLLSVPALARRTTVVRGVFYPRDLNGAEGNEHDVGFARLYSGAKVLSIGKAPWAGAASIDQVIGRKWGTDPLNLAVLASVVSPFPKPGFNHRRTFSYLAPGVQRPAYVDPFDAYSALFGAPGEAAPEARRRLLQRKSALASPRQELEEMRGRLGRAEREKLDLHVSAVDELEHRLGRMSSRQDVVCAARPPRPRAYREEAPELLVSDERAIPELTSVMTDLVAAAFACDLTRVATLQLGYAGARWLFDWEGVHRDAHEELAHKDSKDDGVDPDVTSLLVRVHRWYATQIAELAKKLAAIPEGDGTMLDNTLIAWGSELGRGDHSLENVPIVLIGGAAGAIQGGRLVDEGPQPFQRVGCTILRAMGENVSGYGDEPTCGPLRGIS